MNDHRNRLNASFNFPHGHPAFANGHARPNNYHDRVNGHGVAINGHSNPAHEYPPTNNVAKANGLLPCGNRYRNIMSGCQNGLFINKMVVRDELTKPSRPSNVLRNNQHERAKEIQPRKENKNVDKCGKVGVGNKNGIDRLVSCQNAINDRLAVEKKELGKDKYGIPVDLKQILRPAAVQKRQEIFKVNYDPEDINGPYNFRQLLRPAEYLPTESLRKRKGGLACNGVTPSKDKVPEKHVKRRAPLAPNQNKFVNVNK